MISRRSTLAEVAGMVAEALRQAGFEAVLTGGACAALYTRGAYHSSDLDFILLSGELTTSVLDRSMAEIGFRRRGNEYLHARTDFFVEFPRGPLSIGSDVAIRPVTVHVKGRPLKTLTPTDSCRDRLAAFYFWNDRQSLRTAVLIASAHPVNLRRIGRWSRAEGHEERYREFLRELRLARAASK